MTELVAAIDDWTNNNFPDLARKLFGFVELTHRTTTGTKSVGDQPIPVTINGTSDRQQVSLDDRYQLITWVRLPGRIGVVDNPEWSFGLKESRFQTANFRWVIAHKVELGENLIYSMVDAFPEKLSVDGFTLVFVNPQIDIDFDHEAIYQTELGNTVYEKHRFPWNLYVINLNLEFIVCEGYRSQASCCEDSLLAEDGADCLITES